MKSFKTQPDGTIREVPTTTIINRETYNAEYANKSGSSLIFEEDLWDCKSYVDSTKLRKNLCLKGRGKILHVLVRRKGDPLFINKANTDIPYKYRVCSDSDMDGATRDSGSSMYTVNHPIGHVIVVLAE